jgi:hypothetical protein
MSQKNIKASERTPSLKNFVKENIIKVKNAQVNN